MTPETTRKYTRLTTEQKDEIRGKIKDGQERKTLAEEYGVSLSTIVKVAKFDANFNGATCDNPRTDDLVKQARAFVQSLEEKARWHTEQAAEIHQTIESLGPFVA